jgi:hypothetical protein
VNGVQHRVEFIDFVAQVIQSDPPADVFREAPSPAMGEIAAIDLGDRPRGA